MPPRSEPAAAASTRAHALSHAHIHRLCAVCTASACAADAVAEGESSGMSTSAPARVSPGSKPLQKDGGTPNKLDEGSVSTISHDTEVVAFAHDADVVAFAASTSTAIEAGVMTGIALKSAADRPVEAMPITTARHVEVEDVTEFDEMDLEELEMVEPATEL